METVIFYFSGTGNSLTVARDIANKLGHTRIISIAEAIQENHIELHEERIGFVFPVHDLRVPSIVKRFIRKLKFNTSHYIFSVATFGGLYGIAFYELDQYVKESGGRLHAGFPVIMPGNSIHLYNAYPPVIQNLFFKWAKKKAGSISEMVREKRSHRIPKGSLLLRHYLGSDPKPIEDSSKMAEKFHANETCIGCKTCERICPVSNIKMVDKKPIWGIACEQCVACIQWCPVKAIEYSTKTATRKQYRHPEVKLSDMLP
ncbi:EFR1 family ferrodoxin [Gorillibacterium timonense]|uniref:EFR1 family ferrodoxin n=1 Tax=Gorillibacterium timonense TaxID=1689269 RepID=UPI00071E527C|nr:EFR1 family ferrodoxin [Gorillibacterium timonense]